MATYVELRDETKAVLKLVITQMRQLDAGQVVKIRGREVERVDLERRLDSLNRSLESYELKAARQTRTPYHLATIQRARRSG